MMPSTGPEFENDIIVVGSFHCSINSAIHKAAGLTVPGSSMILPGTIPETPISCGRSWWLEQPLGVIPTERMPSWQFCE